MRSCTTGAITCASRPVSRGVRQGDRRTPSPQSKGSNRMLSIDNGWQQKLARCAPLLLRAIVGYGFMAHGYAKLMKGPDAFVAIVHAIGVPAPFFMAWLTILIELFGGLAVLLAAFLVPLSFPIAGVHLVALFTILLPSRFTPINPLAITPSRPPCTP